MRRRAQRNCKIAILLVLCIAGFFQFVSNGGGGGKDSSGGPGPGRHGHPQRHLRKPKRVFNGTMFVPNKELASLAQLQGGRVESLYFEVDADERIFLPHGISARDSPPVIPAARPEVTLRMTPIRWRRNLCCSQPLPTSPAGGAAEAAVVRTWAVSAARGPT